MKVLKHGVYGKPDPDYYLRCSECGCELEAIAKIYKNPKSFEFDYAYAKCPECETEYRKYFDYSMLR